VISPALKIAYTLFVAVLVPVYWLRIGWQNFLWLSDIALLLTLAGLWWEQRLLLSVAAVGALLPDVAWTMDFLARLLLGADPFGLQATAYMLDAARPAWLRGLSLFHVFLPAVLLWAVRRLGYDRRALVVQAAICAAVLPLSHALAGPQRNVNWVYGLGWQRQEFMPDPAFVALLWVGYVVIVFIPAHVLLRAWAPRTRR